jgi:hypothetical protein
VFCGRTAGIGGEHGDEVMDLLRSWMLVCGAATLASVAAPGTVSAEAVEKLRCVAADIALQRGHDAMQGTGFVAADGKTYFLGKSQGAKEYLLTAQDEATVIEIADALTPGAIEYVDLWLVGPGAIGRSKERVMTESAKAFNLVLMTCLAQRGT